MQTAHHLAPDLSSPSLGQLVVAGGSFQEPALGVQYTSVGGLVLQLQLRILYHSRSHVSIYGFGTDQEECTLMHQTLVLQMRLCQSSSGSEMMSEMMLLLGFQSLNKGGRIPQPWQDSDRQGMGCQLDCPPLAAAADLARHIPAWCHPCMIRLPCRCLANLGTGMGIRIAPCWKRSEKRPS